MRLIMEYTVSDGCSYSYDVIKPIEYESEEAFIVDFEAALDKAILKKTTCLYIVNIAFDVCDFTYINSSLPKKPVLNKSLPHISTLENWFELNKKLEV